MEHEVMVRTGDIVTLVLYFLITVGIGFWGATKSRTTEGYFVGGRAVPGWAVGLSMLGTAISSVTFLAYPGNAFAEDWSNLVPGLMLPFAAIIGAYVFVPFYRSTRFTSAYQYLEHRYGTWARVYGCLLFTLGSAWRMGSILYLLSLAMIGLTGWDLRTVIIVVGFLVTLYTVAGGIEAVIWTDVLQTIVLVGGGLAVILDIFSATDVGPVTVFSQGWAEGKFNLTVDFDFDLTRKTFWVLMLNGLIGNIQEFASDQTKVQRYCAAASEKEARGAVWFTGLACIPVWTLFMFVGTCLYVFYRVHPDPAVEAMRSDSVFPHFILTQLPVGLGGFVVAAVLAAAMSSIDSSMNGTATVLTVDIYRRLLVKGKDDKHYLFIARAITTLAGVFMVLTAIAITFIGADTILPWGFTIGAIVAGGLGGIFVLGFFSTRANSQGLLIGVFAAISVIVFLTLSEADKKLNEMQIKGIFEEKKAVLVEKGSRVTRELEERLMAEAQKEFEAQGEVGFRFLPPSIRSRTHGYIIGVIGNLTALIVGYLASLLFPKPSEKQLDRATWWTRRPLAEGEDIGDIEDRMS